MQVLDALKKAQNQIDSDSSRLDAEYLLAFVLQKNLTWLKTWPDSVLSEKQLKDFYSKVERRLKGEPIAYIIGERGFWSLSLETNSSTLIPRPETELLVELALDFLLCKKSAEVLDLGTGTGAIALAIASERPTDKVTALDFSSDAIALANRNAKRNQIQNVQFIVSDWFAQLNEKTFDLIVTNPPYIEKNDPHLAQGDLRFEPASALVAEDNGLADIKKIVATAARFLKEGGALMIEHGFEQGQAVRDILSSNGFINVASERDLGGNERVSQGIWRKGELSAE